MMSANRIAVLILASCSTMAAKPGDLDQGFRPELRALVAPDRVSIAPDGRAWIGGGFDQGDGNSSGDLLRLGENGGVESEPAPGYLKTSLDLAVIGGESHASLAAPFFLTSGDFLLPGESGGSLRLHTAGKMPNKAFPDRMNGEEIIPQFEAGGKLWTIRKSINGQRALELRTTADGLLDGAFTGSADLPRNVNEAVPAPGGGAWVLVGDAPSWYSFWMGNSAEQKILNVDASGRQRGAAISFVGSRSMKLRAGAGGAFRVELGPDLSRWMYWPAPTDENYTLEWYSPGGAFERRISFQVSEQSLFTWAEGRDGSLLATRGKGSLVLYGLGETTPQLLSIHRGVRSIKSLPDGKWLIDGLYRLHADGGADESWQVPELSAPAQVTTLLPMPDGRMLAAGNFALADGIVRNRLVLFRSDGSVDPSFIPDERIGEWRSVAVTRQAIYGVTVEPVAYGESLRSNLVKLRLDGSLDEGYQPAITSGLVASQPPLRIVDHASKIHALKDGDILVEAQSYLEVGEQSIHRLKSDGSRDPAFKIVRSYHSYGSLLPITGGGFVKGAIFYRRDGTIALDLSKSGFQLQPLCEHLGSVIFQETAKSGSSRLRLWHGRGWAAWFRAPTLDDARGIIAVPGERGTLHVGATLKDGSAALSRLLPNGRLDRSFRQPAFGHRKRLFPGDWWTAEEDGKLAFDPAKNESASTPRTLVWQAASRRLWVGERCHLTH